MFKGFILLIWGGNLYTYPEFLPEAMGLKFGSIYIAPVYSATLIISVIFLVLFGLFFKKSAQGIYMRSVADKPEGGSFAGRSCPACVCPFWAIAALVASMSGIVLELSTASMFMI